MKSLNEGAIEPWTKPRYRPLLTELKRFARRRAFRSMFRGGDLEPEQQRADY